MENSFSIFVRIQLKWSYLRIVRKAIQQPIVDCASFAKQWNHSERRLTRRQWTSDQWVTDITFETTTNWRMIDNVTESKLATRSRARILAFIVYASAIRWTFRVGNTFWSTFHIRIAIVFGYTFTRSNVVSLFAQRVNSTGRWMARLRRFFVFISMKCTTEDVSKQCWKRKPTEWKEETLT